jgi:fermentation-respiration switch protein FrsA (DUF1100 family)
MKKNNMMKRVAGWITTLVLAYLVFILSLGVMQRHLMYFPDPAPFVPAEWALRELQAFPVTTEDGLQLISWYMPPKTTDKFTIVFFQGNAGHLGHRNYKVRPWIEAGYGVLMVGYRGYGNPGKPSEEGLYDDARSTIQTLLAKNIPENALVLYGESMGTGVAVQMATEFDASGLILESPYTSIPDVGADRYPLVPVHILLSDRYDSLHKIDNVHMPLLLLHGEKDNVVPTKFGRELFAAAHEPKQAEYVPDAGHNDVYNAHVEQVVLDFISKLPTDGLLKLPEN